MSDSSNQPSVYFTVPPSQELSKYNSVSGGLIRMSSGRARRWLQLMDELESFGEGTVQAVEVEDTLDAVIPHHLYDDLEEIEGRGKWSDEQIHQVRQVLNDLAGRRSEARVRRVASPVGDLFLDVVEEIGSPSQFRTRIIPHVVEFLTFQDHMSGQIRRRDLVRELVRSASSRKAQLEEIDVLAWKAPVEAFSLLTEQVDFHVGEGPTINREALYRELPEDTLHHMWEGAVQEGSAQWLIEVLKRDVFREYIPDESILLLCSADDGELRRQAMLAAGQRPGLGSEATEIADQIS